MIDPIALSFWKIQIHWYGILIAAGVLLGTVIACRRAGKYGISQETVLNGILVVVPTAIVFSRAYYVIFSWKSVISSGWTEIFAIWHGGLAIHGAVIGGALAAYWYIRQEKIPFAALADLLTPSLILGQAIGRWGNFINQEAYGTVVSTEFISRFPDFIKNQMYINGAYHHPTFLYESLWDAALFVLLMALDRKPRRPGQLTLVYLAGYSLARFFIEGLRTDSLMLGEFRVAQVVSVCIIILCVIIQYRFMKTANNR
ncbi:MAG: prolipoprotein diacylglyceryl transferase [Firmicutes bacterium]|nr:prolipoprotein diacylglyceryl transferase [Bacillota bacterium]